MKKLVLVAALFMFVCGGTFLAQAKAPVEQPSKTTTLSNDTVVTDTLQKAENVQDTAKVAQYNKKAVSSLSILGNGFFYYQLLIKTSPMSFRIKVIPPCRTILQPAGKPSHN